VSQIWPHSSSVFQSYKTSSTCAAKTLSLSLLHKNPLTNTGLRLITTLGNKETGYISASCNMNSYGKGRQDEGQDLEGTIEVPDLGLNHRDLWYLTSLFKYLGLSRARFLLHGLGILRVCDRRVKHRLEKKEVVGGNRRGHPPKILMS